MKYYNTTWVILLLSFLITFFGCMSRGSTFSNANNAYETSPNKTRPPQKTDVPIGAKPTSPPQETPANWDNTITLEPTPEPTPEQGIYISGSPSGASIYINGYYEGTSSVFIPNPSYGRYTIRVEKDKYKPQERSIEYYGGRVEYSFILEEITGYLEINVNARNFTLSAGSKSTNSRRLKLIIGDHSFRVEAFGYYPYRGDVIIYEDQTTRMDVILEPIPFSIENPSLNRKLFNPENPGYLGKINLTYGVTAPGEGEITIQNSGGKIIYEENNLNFSKTSQSFTWTGLDWTNKQVEDGIYTITIRGTGSLDEKKSSKTIEVKVDHSYVINMRNTLSGNSGITYAATTDALPQGSFQVNTITLFSEGDIDGVTESRAFMGGAVRVGLPGKGEFIISQGFNTTSGENVPFFISGAYKKELFRDSTFSGALTARGTYHVNTGSDMLTNYTGLSIGLPLQLHLGDISFILNPEGVISPFDMTNTPDYKSTRGFYVWTYLRGGMLIDKKTHGLSLSLAAGTESFTTGSFVINLPIHMGMEGYFMVPGAPVFISAFFNVEYENQTNWYTLPGIGLSFIH